jgi:hypothetical protein
LWWGVLSAGSWNGLNGYAKSVPGDNPFNPLPEFACLAADRLTVSRPGVFYEKTVTGVLGIIRRFAARLPWTARHRAGKPDGSLIALQRNILLKPPSPAALAAAPGTAR